MDRWNLFRHCKTTGWKLWTVPKKLQTLLVFALLSARFPFTWNFSALNKSNNVTPSENHLEGTTPPICNKRTPSTTQNETTVSPSERGWPVIVWLAYFYALTLSDTYLLYSPIRMWSGIFQERQTPNLGYLFVPLLVRFMTAFVGTW